MPEPTATTLKRAVSAVVRNATGQILCVSRKDNHSSFSLVGGKVDDTDQFIEDAIVREAQEETGLQLTNLNLVDVCDWGGYRQYVFTADGEGDIFTNEPHVVKWGSPQDLIDGAFGEYNAALLRKLEII